MTNEEKLRQIEAEITRLENLEQPEPQLSGDSLQEIEAEIARLEQEDSRPLYEQIEVDSDYFNIFSQPVTNKELERYSQKYGVDSTKLRDIVGWQGGQVEDPNLEEGLRTVAGRLSNALAFGAAGFAAKKADEDPQFRAAVDDLNQLISKKQSYLSDVVEIAGGMGAGSAIKGGVKAGSKYLAKEAAEELAEEATKKTLAKTFVENYDPITAVSSSAVAGVMNSREDEEAKSAIVGAALGLGFYGVVAGGSRAISKIKNRASHIPEDAQIEEVVNLPEMAEEVKIFDTTIRKVIKDIEDNKHETFLARVNTEAGMQKLVDSPNSETRMQALKFIDFMKKKYKRRNAKTCR